MAVSLQPAVVPTTEYVKVPEKGMVEMVLLHVVQLNPKLGIHRYVVAPLAERFTGVLGQTGMAGPLTIILGIGLTVTIIVILSLQPVPFIPSNVYVVVVVGVAKTVAVLVELSPLDGLQVYVLPPLAVNDTPLPPTQIKGLGLFTDIK